MGLPEVRIVVEVGEGTWVEEFGGIEVPVRVEMGDVGAGWHKVREPGNRVPR